MLGIFALGIPASSGLLVRSSVSRSRLHDLATTVIREELGLRATIGRVQLQLVPFSIVASDITLDDPIYGRIAEAEELRIQPSFRALLRGALDLNVITIRGANLRLVVRNGQVRNLPRAEASSGGGPPTLPFDALHVIDSSVTLDAEPHASGQLSDVDLTVRGIDGGIGVSARIGDGWVRHAGGEERLEHVDGTVEITEHALRIPSLALRTPELRVTVQDGAAPMTFGDHGYEGHVTLRYELAHLARLPLPDGVTLPPFEGRIETDLHLDTEDAEQRAEGTIDLTAVRIGEFGLGDGAHLIVRADRRRVSILEGSVARNAHGGGDVAVEGHLDLDPERGFPLEVTAGLSDFSFARLMSTLGVTQNGIVEWMFDGTLGLEGTLVPIALEGPVRLRTRDFRVTHDPYHAESPRRVIGVSRGDFTGRWSIRPDAVRFSDLVGELPRSRIRGDVHLGFDNRLGVTATAEVDLRDITPLDRWPIAGIGTARVDIDRTFQDPHVTGHVQLSDFLFDTFRLGTVESDVVLDPDGMGARFAMVHATKGESRYRAEDLYLDFHDDRFAMTGLVHLDGLLLQDFYHVLGFEEDERFISYQGLARGQASVRYTNGYPGDAPSGTLDVDMNLAFDWTTLDDFRFEDGRLVGRWRWLDWDRGARGAELSIAHLTLTKGAGTLALDGDMHLGGELEMDVVADRIALSELEGIGDRLPGLDGVASVVGRIGGNVDVMRADFDVGVTNVTQDGRPLGDGRFYVRMTDRDDPYVTAARAWDRAALPDEPCAHARDGLAYADWPADPPLRTRDGPEPRLLRPMAYLICGRGLDDRLAVDLAVGRTRPLPLRGRIALDDLDLGPFLPEAARERRVAGSLSGALTFTGGALREPESLEGTVTLGEVAIALADIEIRNRRDVALSFAGGVIDVDRARFVGAGSRLRVRGRASLDDGYALNVDSDIDLGILARVSDAIEDSSGEIEARLSVSGPLDDPELYGDATVTGGTFQFAGFAPALENVDGRIRFSQRSVLFEGFDGDIAGGRLEASGSAELRETGVERYAFDVEARGLSHTFAEGVDASFGASTRLAWERGDRLPRLSGTLNVSRFDYTRPIELRSLGDVAANAVRGMFRRERTEVRRYDPEEDSIAIDLQIAQSAPFRIANNLLTADVRIDSADRDFRLVGTDQRYGLAGAMRITSGNIFFQNNEFDVRRGVIQFDDETRIDPHVDVEAVTNIRRSSDLSSINWRVILRLSGSADNLRLQTESDPDLPEPDILMLLAFGMTRSELSQLQAGDVGGVAALEALTSVTGVDREIRRALPLIDDVRLTTGYSMRTGRTEPRLSVGKRLAERVRLSATTGLSESREFRGALEWQLDDNMRVGLSYDNYNIDPANSFGNLGVDWGYRLEFE